MRMLKTFFQSSAQSKVNDGECNEKWSEYYTCKECDDEGNRKGHLTKPQEAVHVEMIQL